MRTENKQLIQYYPPDTRRAMANAFVSLSNEEIALAKQVEETLASSGVVVPGSVYDTSRRSGLIFRILSALRG